MVPFYVMKGIRDTRVVLSAGLFAANLICILLVLNLLSTNFGFPSITILHLLSIFLLLGVVLLNVPLRQMIRSATKTNPQITLLIFGILLCLFGFLLLILSNTQLLWICSVPVILSGLDLCLQGIDHRRNELHLLAVACFGYGVLFLFLETIPWAWSLYQQGSLFISHLIGVLTNTPFSVGPTSSGLGILLVSLIFLFSVFVVTPRKTRKDLLVFSLSIGGACLVWLCYLVLLNQSSYLATDALNLHPYFFLFNLIPIFSYLFFSQKIVISNVPFYQKKHLQHHLKNGAVWAVILLLLSTTLLTIFINVGPSSLEQQKVLFYGDHMVGTWDVPGYGTYGKDAVGMFGLWPIYLATLGYDSEILVQNRTQFLATVQTQDENITRYVNLTDYTTVSEIKTITTSTFDNTAIFVVSNLNVSFSEQEQSIIWDYVNKGGALLVIGDHTNVGGMQQPLNELLTPVGIRYRFDAALPFDEKFKWLTCIHLLHHPITASLMSLDELQYGIGASLDLSESAFPIIIGSSVLSDKGNRLNSDIAYLGDYEYNKGEQLGDVILAAGAYYGNGKVLVFGDTSSFQNAALPFSYSFLQSSFLWLSNQQTSTMALLQVSISLLLLTGAIIVYLFFKNKTISFAWLPLLLCISLLFSAALNPLLITTPQEKRNGTIAYIDASHNERFSLESFTDDSVNGLLINLERNNLMPVLLREFSQESILKSDLLIFNAPTKAFSADDVGFLQSYMNDGGIVILATGYEDKAASLPLLKTFDLDIESIPLGPVPYVEENLTLYQNEPRFVDSWPVSFQQNQTISFYNFTWGDLTYHLVVFTRQGAGGLLLIGDSQFLLDKNIESIYDYWPGNILFLKYLLDELRIPEEKR